MKESQGNLCYQHDWWWSPWYTNTEHNGRKDKTNPFYFYGHNMHTSCIKRKNTQVCPMNKQYMEGLQNFKNVYLLSVGNLKLFYLLLLMRNSITLKKR